MLSDSDIRERLGPVADPAPDQGPSRSKRQRSLIAALAVLVVLLWGGGAALLLHLARTCPREAEPRSGRVYRITDTRHTIYVTAKERYAAWGGVGAPLLATLILVVVALPRKSTPVEPS